MRFLQNRLLVSCILALIGLFLSRVFYTQTNIGISFHVNAEQNFTFQVFYQDKSDGNFNEQDSVRQQIISGSRNVHIILPVEHIYKIRLDFGSNPGNVTISDLVLHSKPTTVLDITKFQPYNIHTYSTSDENIVLYSDSQDPYIVYKPTLDVAAGVDVDWCVLFILACLYFFGFYKLYNYFPAIIRVIKQSHGGIVSLFFAMLCIPMLHISDATKSDTENRTLAVKPHLIVDGHINSKFGTEFDSWFNDRFFGRNVMVKLHDMIFQAHNNRGNGKVLIGHDNWLFFHDSIRDFPNRYLFPDADMLRFTQYLQSIDTWCKKNGVKFMFVIAPDKHRIYGEHVRQINKVRPDSDSKIERLLDYIAENSDVHTLYLKDVLMAHKDDGLLYYKNDTHWNNYGAYLGYLHIMEHLQRTPIEPLSINTEQMCSGDLTRMMTSIPQDCDSVYKLPVFPKNAVCDPYKEREDVHCNNGSGRGRVFVLRDSFTNGLTKYFNETFSMTDYKWRYDFQASDLTYIQESNIDTVMLIMVERHVYQLKDIEFPKD